MIELKHEQPAAGRREHRLILDGVELTSEQAYVFGIGGRDVSISIREAEAAILMRRQRLVEIPPEVVRVTVEHTPPDRAVDLTLRPGVMRERMGDQLRMSYVFSFRVPLWKRPYSMG